MKPLYDDLWISTPEFPAEETANDLMMHGFMLRHPRGNLLIGRVEQLLDHEVLADAGGVIRHYFTHWHEAAPGARAIQQRFNSALYCHSRSLGPVSLVIEPDETFTHQDVHFGDFSPAAHAGHTPGTAATCITHRSARPTCLSATPLRGITIAGSACWCRTVILRSCSSRWSCTARCVRM